MVQIMKWVVVQPQVFVDFTNNEILLYDTEKSTCFISGDDDLISLIHQLYEPMNMGVLRKEQIHNCESEDIRKAFNEGFLVEKSLPIGKRPVNFLHIPNIQYDLEKENTTGIEQLKKFRNTLNLITALYFQLTDGYAYGDVAASRNRVAKQYSTPSYHNTQNVLSPTLLNSILSEARFTQLTNIDILIASEGLSKEYLNVLEQHRFNYHFHVYNQDFETLIRSLNSQKKILISCYCEDITTIRHFNLQEIANISVEYIGLVEKEIKNSETYDRLLPVWNDTNQVFFRENVFLESNEILSSKYTFDDIFRHKKINANFFGALMIHPSGDITPYLSDAIVGQCSYEQNNLQKAVKKELIENHRWRLTRDKGTCKNCIKRFLCPSITSFECNFRVPKICFK